MIASPQGWHVSQVATDTPDDPGNERRAIVSNEHRPIAVVCLGGTAAIDNEVARMIATAPRMAAALRDLLNAKPIRGELHHARLEARRALEAAGVKV